MRSVLAPGNYLIESPVPDRPFEDRPITSRPLPKEVERLREAQERDDKANGRIIQARIEAQTTASRMVLDQLEESHRELADQTDLDLTAYSRASAIWLLSGRLLGLAEAMWVQVNAGISNEALITGRSIHEAARVLRVLLLVSEEDLLRLWLDDEGKHRYVKPKTARAAQERFEEALAEAMTRQGLKPLEGSVEKTEEMYDLLSRVAHNRRSACIESVWEPGRIMAYGRHSSPLRRGGAVEWGGTMTVEIALSVGEGLGHFAWVSQGSSMPSLRSASAPSSS